MTNGYFYYKLKESRRGPSDLCGRTDGNIKVVIPNTKLSTSGSSYNQDIKPGDYILVKVSIMSIKIILGLK